MARVRKLGSKAATRQVDARAPQALAPPPAHESDLGSGLMWLGWTLAALGALAGAFGGGTLAAPIGWGTALVGVTIAVFGIVRHAASPQKDLRSWALSAAGIVLLVAGAAGLLYPGFVTDAELRVLREQAAYAPLLAVSLAVTGVVLLLVRLQRLGAIEPLAADGRYDTWGERISLLWPPSFLRFMRDSWAQIDREAAAEREAGLAAGRTGYDWRPIIVFAVGAVCLALMEYFGHQSAPPNGVVSLRLLFDVMAPRNVPGDPNDVWRVMRSSPFTDLLGFAWWSGWRVLGFFVLPAVVVKLVLRQRLADYGLATAGFLRHAWIYVLFFGIVLVCVIVVSHEDSFRTYYPFYGHASRSWYDFWAWELLYAAQFFSLEFFFRGFWLSAAKRAMGSHAIYAMVVPYCMIHFGKPFLETLAAIIAGIVLGTLALRTRSIWSGFLIHVSVALAMDIAALLQTAGLPDRWWPQL